MLTIHALIPKEAIIFTMGYDMDTIEDLNKLSEKQGEQNLANSAKTCKDEQNHVDEVEPKFHDGDWVVYCNDICQIVKREEGCNKLVTVFGIEKELVNERNLSTARLWTIQDAKAGDVLASKDGDNILIFRNLDTSTSFSSYYNIQGKGELGWSNGYFIPATKEQRDQLEKAMDNAGYTFDFDKKELKKVEQKPAKWDEENEKLYNRICDLIHEAAFENCETDEDGKELGEYAKMMRLLKSFKDRVQPQCEWGEGDENLTDIILSQLRSDNFSGVLSKSLLKEAESWLNSLKDRVQSKKRWKPSGEQMKFLHKYAEQNNYDGAILTLLYNDLKKLKE